MTDAERMEKLEAVAKELSETGTHSYTCALTVTDYEQGIECDCGWRTALDAYLSLAALRTTKEGEDTPALAKREGKEGTDGT